MRKFNTKSEVYFFWSRFRLFTHSTHTLRERGRCVSHTHTHSAPRYGVEHDYACVYVNFFFLYALATNKARTIDFAFWTFSISICVYRLSFVFLFLFVISFMDTEKCCLLLLNAAHSKKKKSYKYVRQACTFMHACACLCTYIVRAHRFSTWIALLQQKVIYESEFNKHVRMIYAQSHVYLYVCMCVRMHVCDAVYK